MTRDTNLYEICPACSGTGTLAGPIVVRRAGGQVEDHDSYPCPACKPLRVVPVGVTTGQLERMAQRETIEAERRAGYDRATGTVTKGGG